MIKPLDFAVILLTLGIISLYIIDTLSINEKSKFVKVEADGKIYIYPLDSDSIHTFTGPVGLTVVKIENGNAGIVESDCPNKTCVQAGFIKRAGEVSACLPNRVLLTITGEDENEVDTISF